MDAFSVKIGESVVDVTNIYKKGEPLIFTIKCPKPSPTQPDYSGSAVLNVGWKPDGKMDKERGLFKWHQAPYTFKSWKRFVQDGHLGD